MFAITWYDDPKAASLFRKHGSMITDINGKDTPLVSAILWKRFSMAKWLLDNGADPNTTDPEGRTPLLYAVKRKYSGELIKLLIEHGADPDSPDDLGNTARKIASSYRDKTILEML